MNLLYPKLRWCWLPAMLGLAALGAVIAGLYGIAHDQLTYTLAPEYFTKLKFRQFHYANFGWPVRVFVGEIGFLATWWVGFIAGWLLARVAVPVLPVHEMFRVGLRGFIIMLGFVFASGCIGYACGLVFDPRTESSDIAFYAGEIGVVDVSAFARVAYIHNAGYLGGLVGLIVALIRLKRKLRDLTPRRAPGCRRCT
jgi:hypothetical protein